MTKFIEATNMNTDLPIAFRIDKIIIFYAISENVGRGKGTEIIISDKGYQFTHIVQESYTKIKQQIKDADYD